MTLALFPQAGTANLPIDDGIAHLRCDTQPELKAQIAQLPPLLDFWAEALRRNVVFTRSKFCAEKDLKNGAATVQWAE